MALHLTEQQKQIVKIFEQLERDFHYQPVSEKYLPGPTSLQKQQSKQYSQQQISKNQIQILQYLQPNHEGYSQQHLKLQNKLYEYRNKSNLVTKISGMLHEYDINFKHLKQQRAQLLTLISSIHQETSELLDKQKKFIDLSNAVKQALDYYDMLDKFQFNYVCQLAYREVFQDQLQPILSHLTDGIQFFTINTNYFNAKKYLNGLVAAKSKVTSFTRAFLVKLLNKQQTFSMKNAKNQLYKNINGFYPKSKPKFLADYLLCFPQLLRQLKIILISTRQASSQAESNSLIKIQTEIQGFILNDSTMSMILYLQKNASQIYEQVILKFISFYRTNFHESFHRNLSSALYQQNSTSQNNSYNRFQHYFHDIFVQSVYIITCEAAYLQHMFNPCTQIARQYAKGTVTKIAQLYGTMLVKLTKQPNTSSALNKNKNPFKICNQVSAVQQQIESFFRNYSTRQYQTYALGALIQRIQAFGIDLLKSIFKKICNKIISELENVCQNMLPKYKQTSDKAKLTTDIKQFVDLIPNLLYCPSQAQKYLIASLDTLIKSIKQVSNRIQSRLECYAWNLQIFSLMDHSLDKLPYSFNLIKKQMKIDLAETTNMIQKVKSVNRNQNLLKYATDLFSVIKTGVPTLSQLTLDFHSFIKEYYRQLKQKFVRDMVYVHGKNIIQFLQTLKQFEHQIQGQKQSSMSQGAQQKQKRRSPEQFCQKSQIRNLQSSYKLSIQNYVVSANNVIKLRQQQFAIFGQQGKCILITLLKQIRDALVDLMSTFYVQVSKFTEYAEEVQKFQNIGLIRSQFQLNKQ